MKLLHLDRARPKARPRQPAPLPYQTVGFANVTQPIGPRPFGAAAAAFKSARADLSSLRHTALRPVATGVPVSPETAVHGGFS